MSRIGKQPISIPPGVTVSLAGRTVTVKGPKGALNHNLPKGVDFAVAGNQATVTRTDDSRQNRSLHGLTRSLVANMVAGADKGFRKDLEIQGVGFKAALQGRTLSLSLGFAGPKQYAVPDGVDVQVNDGTKIVLSGADKQMVGEAAARVRSYFPAEPYKGKGIRYLGERVRRKVGKTVS